MLPHRAPVALGALLLAAVAAAVPGKAGWPVILRDGIPRSLPGWEAAPSDPLPDTDENEMGNYTEVSRFFQRIEPSRARQFRIVVQDYGKGADLEPSIRKAVAEAGKSPGVEAVEVKVAKLPAYAVTDRSQGQPTTLVTVVVTPFRLVLGQGANVEREEAVKLLSLVDYARVAAAN
jgi:hypothetical protein